MKITRHYTYFLLIAFTTAIFIWGCNEKKNKQVPVKSDVTYLAVITRSDSSKSFEYVRTVVSVVVKYDSLKKDNIIAADTVYGVRVFQPRLDSAKREIRDSSGKQVIDTGWIAVSRSIINFDIANKSVDSLLKKH